MNIASLVGTGAAWLNLRKAKREYEAIKEEYDTLLAAVQTYNDQKWNKYDEKYNKPVDIQGFPDGLLATTVLRVGNLVGKYFRARTTVVLSNTSDKPIYIHTVETGCYIFGKLVPIFDLDFLGQQANEIPQIETIDKTIAPGETISVQLPKGISGLVAEDMDKLRETICAVNGKKLITSCPKTNIESDCETADIKVVWEDRTGGAYIQQVGYTLQKPGVLRYVGEAYYD